MKKPLYLLIALLAVACGSKSQQSTQTDDDCLAQYRDTLVGKFNGIDIDTLICEPIDSLSVPEYEGDFFGNQHYKWRVFTTNGTVKDLIIENTIGIDFVKEGDLDSNGTEEWGYVSQYPTSQWENYNIFTATNKEWKLLVPPTAIWESHIDITEPGTITPDDIAQPSETKGYVNIKFSDIRNNGEDFLLVDTTYMAIFYK